MNKKYILGIIALSLVGILVVTFFVFKQPRQTITTKDQAIAYLQQQYPELKEYPSDNLPPRSIVEEKADEGWYVAFVQEGSGRPIIEADCFWVKEDKSIIQRKYVPQDNTSAGDFSAKECRVIESFVGGDKDEHGCIGSAGYSWCQEKQKCLRIWEEPCGR